MDENEIDLIKLTYDFWEYRKSICAIILLTVAIVSMILFNMTPTYVSKISYSNANIPPFYKGEKVLNDFKEKFFSKSVFQDWKNNEDDIKLEYDYISPTKIQGGFLVTKTDDEKKLKFFSSPKNNDNRKFNISRIEIETNSEEIGLPYNIYKYTQYINNLLKTEYLSRAKAERKYIELVNKNKGEKSINLKSYLDNDRYIGNLEQGENVLLINPQTVLTKSKPAIARTLIFSVLIGAIFAIIITYVRISVRIYKKNQGLRKR